MKNTPQSTVPTAELNMLRRIQKKAEEVVQTATDGQRKGWVPLMDLQSLLSSYDELPDIGYVPHNTQPLGVARLSISEAKRLHEEAPALTVTELRMLSRHYFKAEFLTSAKKKTLIEQFRKRLDQCLGTGKAKKS